MDNKNVSDALRNLDNADQSLIHSFLFPNTENGPDLPDNLQKESDQQSNQQ